MTIEELNKILQKHVAIVSKTSGDNQSIERMWPVLERLDNPQRKLRSIHVAGTSGKTSTCYFVTNILVDAGKKVGTTVSPHIDSITERVQINGQPIDSEKFCHYFTEFYDLIGENVDTISYFELLVAFELWVFAREKVDYAVIETGVGGLLDATNVLRRTDKVCVITDIGLDHTHLLGNTIAEIALQKVGIVHAKDHVFYYDQGSEVLDVFKKYTKKQNGILNLVNYMPQEGSIPEFQKRNYILAKAVCHYLAERDEFKLHIVDPAKVIIPARMEVKKLKDGTVLVMDGAHNQQKMHAFVASFEQLYPAKKAVILLALKKGKEFEAIVRELAPITKRLIVTTFHTSPNLPAVSQDPESIKTFAERECGLKTTIIEDSKLAVDELLQDKSSIKIITGSFYLLGDTRKTLMHNRVIVLT